MKKLLITLLAIFCLGAIGPRPARIVLIKFADHDESPCDPAYATDVVFNQYAPWLAQESHNKEWIVPSGVYGPFTLAHPIAYYQCPIGTGGYYSFSGCIGLFDEAAGLVQPYFDPYSELTIFLYNGPIVGAVTGSPDIHTICYSPPEAEYAHLSLHVMKHEGGHAQPERLFHAGSLSCPGGDAPLHYDDPNADGCFVQGYGDPWDPMGSGDDHYSMWMRSRLGWEQASNSKLIERSQTISLADSMIDAEVVQEARIPLSRDGRYLYSVEYRANAGVLVRLVVPQPYYYGVETMLLNIVGGGSFAVTSANPFIDSYRGIRVDLLNSDPLQATILLTIPTPHGGGPHPLHGRSPRDR